MTEHGAAPLRKVTQAALTLPPLQPSCLAEHTFGQRGHGDACLIEGWSAPEAAFTWSTGPQSTLTFLLPGGARQQGDLLLELQLAPFVVPGRIFGQRLKLLLNGSEIANEIVRAPCTLTFPVPRGCLDAASPRQYLRLVHPDFSRPCDFDVNDDARDLGFMLFTLRVLSCPPLPPADITALPPLSLPRRREAISPLVRAATGLDTEQLASCFESLGQNCEFGLVQRHMGAEPLGLFRFAGIAMEDMLAGLRCCFENLGDALTVIPFATPSGETGYDVHETRFCVGFHTFSSRTETTQEAVRKSYRRHLALLRRTFLEPLEAGNGICVVQRVGVISPAQARALLMVLRGFGPNALLFVDQSPDLPSGAVEQLGHGLYHGKLAAFAPVADAGRSDLPGWVSLCVNAHRLWRASLVRQGRAGE